MAIEKNSKWKKAHFPENSNYYVMRIESDSIHLLLHVARILLLLWVFPLFFICFFFSSCFCIDDSIVFIHLMDSFDVECSVRTIANALANTTVFPYCPHFNGTFYCLFSFFPNCLYLTLLSRLFIALLSSFLRLAMHSYIFGGISKLIH